MKVLSTFSGIGCGAGPFDEGSKCIGVADVEIKSLNGEVLRIDDLLDFSNEEISGPIWKESSQAVQKCADISPLCTQTINIHSPAKAKSHSLPVIIDTDTQFADIGVPYDDIAELEWLSNFVEESFSLDQDYKFLGTLEVKNIAGNADQSSRNVQLQTSSSICVVEDNANSDDKRCVRGALSPPARAQRKRTRSGVRTPSVLDTVSAASESSTSSDSPCLSYTSAPANEKTCINHSFSNKFFKYARKRRKMSLHSIKCMHCGIQKTPQWRAGPLGPKTLCNACGVRYKSGRLLPEYRPAASPQYIPEKHSNSHKRVLEMRLQKELRIPHRKQDY